MNKYYHSFKLIIVGDINVGKSCLLSQFTQSKFIQDYDATIGIEFGTRNMTINGKTASIQVWDTVSTMYMLQAGQESYKSITRSYYRGSSGALMVFDVTNRQSYDNIVKWYQEIQGYALNTIQLYLVANKIDLQDKRLVSKQEAEDLAQSLGFRYFETSAKTGQSVESVFENLVLQIMAETDKGSNEQQQEDQSNDYRQINGINIRPCSQNQIPQVGSSWYQMGGCC